MTDIPTNKNSEATPGGDSKEGKASMRMGVFARLRNYFLAGLLVTAPVGLTMYIVWLVVAFVDNRVTPLLPVMYNPETYLPINIPGLGLLVVFVIITLIGALMAGFLGRFILRMGERILTRMPVVRSIYGALKRKSVV